MVSTPYRHLILATTVLLVGAACGQPRTNTSRHEHQPPRTPAATNTSRHEHQPPRTPAATNTSRHEHQPPRTPAATNTSRHEHQPPRTPAATNTSRHEHQPPRTPAATNTSTSVTAPATSNIATAEDTTALGPQPAPTSHTPPSTTTPGGTVGLRRGLLTLLESLAVEAEQPNGYDRGLFRHWVGADGDGCDTRREVLITEAVTAPAVGGRCVLSDGVWVSRYDGETDTGNGGGFDIDHLVPLKEAWDSGAHGWDPQTREQFANDLGFEHSLVAVSAGSNRSKGAQDPTTWLPPESSQRCWYAAAWISVKARWDLSVDSARSRRPTQHHLGLFRQ